MSGKGPRGGRGVGRGRGRGRGKTQIWEWESYTPGAEVYQQLWRVRKEPAIVTARLPNDCPMPNAQTRILNRRQTGDTVNREQYTVEILYTNEAGSGHEDLGRMEVEEVDLRRILQFVSPAELERYETEQFRLEAEAEAIAIRTEAEDLARRQLQKNAKAPENNRGSRMLSGLGLPVARPIRARGRPRGGRGRGRGRHRGLVLSPRQPEDDKRAELVDSEPTATNRQTGHVRQPTQTSPGMARSAFVANSALPESLVSRRLTGCRPLQEHTELSGLEDEVGVALASRDAKSVATLSPSIDRFPQAATLAAPSSTQGSSPSAALGAQLDDMFAQTPLFFDRSSIAASDSDDSIAAQPPLLHHESNEDMNNDTMQMHIRRPDHQSLEYNNNNDADAEGAKEYVVEAIVEHFREDGKNYYLVKWDGYEDSHDWLPEEDLEGAADLVAEYKERVGWRNKKER